MTEELKWEELPSNHDVVDRSPNNIGRIQVHHYRARVPGGWLVKFTKTIVEGGAGGMVLVNDPNHEWQIETVEEKKERLVEEMEQRNREKREEKQRMEEEKERERMAKKRMSKILKVMKKLENENEIWARQGIPEEKISMTLDEDLEIGRDELVDLLEKLVELNYIQIKGHERWSVR